MKRILSTLITFLVPGILLAQDLNYTPLAPSFIRKTDQQTVSDVGSYLNDIYITFFILVIAFSVLFIVLGGIKWSFSQIPGAKGEGKTMITSAIFGLVLALSSWLILNTINPDLVRFRFIPATEVIDTTTGGGTTPPQTTPGQGGVDFGPIPNNEFQARASLFSYSSNANDQIIGSGDNRIRINDEATCNETTQSNCRTYIGGDFLLTNTLVKPLWESCLRFYSRQNNGNQCDFIISGAAEKGGHSSNSKHYVGKAVDIRSEPSFVSFMMNSWLVNQGTACGKTPQELSSGNLEKCGQYYYKWEGSHWHIEVN